MPFTDDPLVVEQVDAKLWKVREQITYHGERDVFAVTPGSCTDFASVPRLVVWLIPTYGIYTKSAILHDYLLRERVVSRRDADGIFRRSLHEQGVSVPRRRLMWAGVRLGSRMDGASVGEWLVFALVAVLAVAFVAVPALAVQVFLLIFWLIELLFWVVDLGPGQVRAPRPKPQFRSA